MRQERFGGPEVLELVELTAPVPMPTEVLVGVRAAGVNPVDWVTRAGLTAWQILVDTADVQPGQRVLITAAGGGVGHFAVQIAKARGAFVVASARQDMHDFLRGLGADETIDYTRTDLATAIRDIDLVVDCLGGDHSVGLIPVLASRWLDRACPQRGDRPDPGRG